MSHILSAIKTDTAIAQGSVLMTLSKYNDDNDIDYVLAEFPPIVQRLRSYRRCILILLKQANVRLQGPALITNIHMNISRGEFTRSINCSKPAPQLSVNFYTI